MLERILTRVKTWHIIPAASVLYLLSLTPHITIGGDDARYVLMSRDFLSRGFLSELFHSPVFEMRLYSFLPLVLMPFSFLAPGNFLLMKIVPFLVSCISLCVVNSVFKDLPHPPMYPLDSEGSIARENRRKLVLILCAVNPWMVEYSTLLLTDILFMLFSLCALRRMSLYCRSAAAKDLLVVILCAACALYTRPAGLILAAALALFLLLRRRIAALTWSMILIGILGYPVFYNLPSLARGSLHQIFMKEHYYSLQPSLHSLYALPSRMMYHLAVYAGNYLPDIMLRPLVISINPRVPLPATADAAPGTGAINPVFAFKFALGLACSLLIIRGYRRTMRAGVSFLHIYLPAYILFCLALNAYVARYLLPLLPLLLFLLFEGIQGNGKSPIAGIQKPVSVVFLILFSASVIGSVQEIVKSRTNYMRPEEKSFADCNIWLKGHTPDSSSILSRKPAYTRLITGREAECWFFTDDPAEQIGFIRGKADYVILGDAGCFLRSARFIRAAIKRYPESFHLLYTTVQEPKNYVYKVIRPRY